MALGAACTSVQALPGYLDHREPEDAPLEVQYGLRHPVFVEPGGLFERLGLAAQFEVNSLHSQGIERLASCLRVEARAPDGLIEAVSMPGAPGFVLGVQWHPEWRSAKTRSRCACFRRFARPALLCSTEGAHG